MHADGDSEALVLKIFEYRDALLAYAFTFLHDWALAEDALQETLVVVLHRPTGDEPIRNVYLWVRRVVFNKCMESLRARRRETTEEEQRLQSLVAQTMDSHLDERAALNMRRMKAALQECMSRLSDSAVDLLTGFYWRRESCERLSGLHARSVNAIKLLLSRTRKHLRECVELRLADGDTE